MIQIIHNNEYDRYSYFTLYHYKSSDPHYAKWSILGHIIYGFGAELCRSIVLGDNPDELIVWADLNNIKINGQEVE